MALLREAVNLYTAGWADARAETRGVLDLPVLRPNLNETAQEDVQAAAALVKWAV